MSPHRGYPLIGGEGREEEGGRREGGGGGDDRVSQGIEYQKL